MIGNSDVQARSIMVRILRAWEDDKEKLLRDLGGIEREHRNEARIQQIEQTIEGLRQALQDNKVSN